ncbi:hypothetical protein SDRG_05606 [Saprolegnia diclina VS20]|uniref:Uncharacterized protein n=1 Tax=Saprolegnia diclina (strain VS20) TaxID=1156394 RepID=T0S1Z3_SAPDV|nr:hypothetical protein SDRG_05606 [Saprolegnia diclina VS20]EQC36772.1 hypothetical protein SDRG_05606 [Saprolegnia diclina VS20]|eukprot:XP_008609553.1 hypothetical protein SDRG_05606 [Saprolegnia diclina VS20]
MSNVVAFVLGAVQCINKAMAQHAAKECISTALQCTDLFSAVVAYFQGSVDSCTRAMLTLCCNGLPICCAKERNHVPEKHSFATMELVEALDVKLVAARMEIDCSGRRACVGSKDLLEQSTVTLTYVVARAAEAGHLELLVHSRETAFGNLALIQFLLAHRNDGGALRTAIMSVLSTDNVELLRYFVDQPGAAAPLPVVTRHAYNARSHKCAALLANDPRQRQLNANQRPAPGQASPRPITRALRSNSRPDETLVLRPQRVDRPPKRRLAIQAYNDTQRSTARLVLNALGPLLCPDDNNEICTICHSLLNGKDDSSSKRRRVEVGCPMWSLGTCMCCMIGLHGRPSVSRSHFFSTCHDASRDGPTCRHPPIKTNFC